MQVTAMTMESINKAKGSLYVVNSSDRNRTKPKGNVIFTVSESDGTTITIELPKTFIPLDVTTWASLDAIKGSTEFRALIRKGAIVAIPNDDAEQYLRSPVAQAEITRLRKDANLFGAIGSSVEKFNLDSGSMTSTTIPRNDDIKVGSKTQINTELMQLVEEFNAGGDDADLANRLRGLRNLTVDDVVWATDQVKATGTEFFNALSEVLGGSDNDTFRS